MSPKGTPVTEAAAAGIDHGVNFSIKAIINKTTIRISSIINYI